MLLDVARLYERNTTIIGQVFSEGFTHPPQSVAGLVKNQSSGSHQYHRAVPAGGSPAVRDLIKAADPPATEVV